ncbi:MAG: type II toxin-antitoxin system HicA family toxin [Opitutaceae bacterium]|jgi:predicted RNA binding protein YcfA (HicA-like mRNA interferase family)|nr:type II toxin-antitoxin system HicA family toxin [Opitutaceae bacterium]
MNTREVIKIITEGGWYEIKTGGGSHRQYRHPEKPGKVTIPFHGWKEELNPKTLKNIKKQAGLQ